jgi:hypothetical protein
MMNICKTLVIPAGLGACALHTPAVAETRGPDVRVVIVGEDADPDTVPRNTPVFDRFLDAIVAQLAARGFQVTREGAAGFKAAPPGVRQNTDELIEAARAVKADPIDALVVLRIHASVEPLPMVRNVMLPQVRVAGRIVSLRSDQKHAMRSLGDFKAGGDVEFEPLPPACLMNRECLFDQVGSKAKDVSAAVVSAIAGQLAAAGGEGGGRKGDAR